MKKTLQRTRWMFPVLLLLAGALVFGVAERARAADSAGYDPKRDPAADVKAAIQEAKAGGRRILLDVGGEWCSWCHVLDKLLTTDGEIRDRLHEGFVVVKVNWSPDNENVRFLNAYPRISGYPHLFVLDGDGTFLWSQNTGQFEAGKTGYDRDKVLAFLKKWSPQPEKTAR